MKKLFLISLFFVCSNVYASETYYSPYSTFSDYQEEEIVNSDLVRVEKKTLYRWYNTETIPGNYYYEGANDLTYPLIKYDDFIYSSYSDWSATVPSNYPNRLVNTRETYYYQDLLPIRIIKIKEARGSYGCLTIPELNIYVNDEEIEYDYLCSSCLDGFDQHINNGDIFEKGSKIRNGHDLTIDLKDEYDIKDIRVEIYLFDDGDDSKIYTLSMGGHLVDEYYEKKFSYQFKSTFSYDVKEYQYTYQDLEIKNPRYGEAITSTTLPETFDTRIMTNKIEYQYQDPMYRYYKETNNYMTDYSEVGNDEYPLKGESVTLYRSQARDKVVIKEDLVIDNKNTNLKDFILESTVDDIKITSNLNMNVNGIYTVNYILPFKTISKEVKVDIQGNLIDALNYKINENKDLKKEINRLNTIINRQAIDIKMVIKDKNQLIDKMNNDLLTLQLKNKELENSKKSLSGDIVIKKSTIINKTLLFVYLVIVLLLAFLFKLKYRLKK